MMLLVLTNASDATADYMCRRLAEADVPFVRLDTDAAVGAMSIAYRGHGPVLGLAGRELTPESTQVWYRRPTALKPPVAGDEGEQRHAAEEWTAALEGFLAHVPRGRWVNHPAANTLASHKMEQLTRARDQGLAVPRTLVTQDPAEFRAFWDACGGHVIVKPISHGYLSRPDPEGDSLIYTNVVGPEHAARGESVRACPTLFQELVPRRTDVRITVVDSDIHAVGLRAKDGGEPRVDIRRRNMAGVEYKDIELPPPLATRLLRLVRSYDLRFAAIDMILRPDGEWVFLEVNPNGQWAWLDLVAGADIGASLLRAARHG